MKFERVENITCEECMLFLTDYALNRTLPHGMKVKVRFHTAECESCEKAFNDFRRSMWGD